MVQPIILGPTQQREAVPGLTSALNNIVQGMLANRKTQATQGAINNIFQPVQPIPAQPGFNQPQSAQTGNFGPTPPGAPTTTPNIVPSKFEQRENLRRTLFDRVLRSGLPQKRQDELFNGIDKRAPKIEPREITAVNPETLSTEKVLEDDERLRTGELRRGGFTLKEEAKRKAAIAEAEAGVSIAKERQLINEGLKKSPAKQASEAAAKLSKDKNKADFDKETGLRKEFTNASKVFRDQVGAKGRVDASAADPSAAGDLSLIFNFMKLLDPGSVVRESEFATAANAAGIPERIRAQYNKVVSGERLANKQRNDFVNRADRLFKSAEKQHKQREGEFTRLAERNNLDPGNIIIDFNVVPPETPSTETGLPLGQPLEIPQAGPIIKIDESGRIIK